ncbi:MAG TPA: glycosyltransferase family 39 protein [Solirubrobacterales bacterium]|nr:glycosyltransferase family 39 protein [Solirubrobacterales bacterium]
MTAERTQSTVLWALAGLTALGLAIRFASLGVQSYHHDEVITAMRVIPGSFTEMLGEVKGSESNPPLYYVLAWGWAKAFGTGEVGLRSLTALFGAATVPVAFLIGRELASNRAGLIASALVAVSPMLIWYSQEARSYALLVFFGALALLFFARALRTRQGRDLGLWALASALALCSHYFAVFAVAIEAVWLLVALRTRWRLVLFAVGGVVAVGLALLPLISAQINPTHIGWIDHSPLSTRLFETGGSFLMGETGHVIAQPPRERYALIPALLIGAALLLTALRGSSREKRTAALGLTIGIGVVLLAAGIALAGKDYIVERNLLPALVPLVLAAAVGFAASGARRVGLALATMLCVYWLAFDVHVARTLNLQRPDFRDVVEQLGSPTRPRAIVTWTLAADGVQFYLDHASRRKYRGKVPIREVDVISKAVVVGRPPNLPPAFRPVERVRLDRLTLTRYTATGIHRVPVLALRDARTGFGRNAVITDGMPPQAEASQ